MIKLAHEVKVNPGLDLISPQKLLKIFTEEVPAGPGVPQASQADWSPVTQRMLGGYDCGRLGCVCVGGLLAHLWGLPVKDVVNVHGFPELHVLKRR